MKFLTALALVFCFVIQGFSQKSLNDYSYVVVPEKFDFVSEKDKYQLNSLTKFLFNKHGFNAYFERELPDVRRCDGLWAEVNGKPAMIRTKVFVILRDCNGEEVYRSEVGTSKLKAYNKTYTAALRKAFLSIEELGVQQQEPSLFREKETAVVNNTDSPVTTLKEPSVAANSEENSLPVNERGERVPYSRNGSQFVLQATSDGYVLIEKSGDTELEKGTIVKNADDELQFKDATGNTFPCYFDDKDSLVIETSFQKLVFTKSN